MMEMLRDKNGHCDSWTLIRLRLWVDSYCFKWKRIIPRQESAPRCSDTFLIQNLGLEWCKVTVLLPCTSAVLLFSKQNLVLFIPVILKIDQAFGSKVISHSSFSCLLALGLGEWTEVRADREIWDSDFGTIGHSYNVWCEVPEECH